MELLRYVLQAFRILSCQLCTEFQQAVVWWKSSPVPPMQNLDPRLPIHTQITAQSFSIANAAVAQDTSAHTHALALEAALGGPDHMAARVGTFAHASLIAAQVLRVREAWPDIWSRTGRVQTASSFLASLVCGTFVPIGEAEACTTGFWVHSNGAANAPAPTSHWDEEILEIVGGNREEGRRIRSWLGDVDTSGDRRRVGTVSRYLIDRYGFDTGNKAPSEHSVRLLIWLLIPRYYCHTLHIGLPIDVPLPLPLTFRCRPFVWANGHLDGSCPSLSTQSLVPHLPSSRPGFLREKAVYCHVVKQVCLHQTIHG